MYIFLLNAYINFVIALAVIIFIILIFPIFISFDLYFDLKYKKVFYKIYLFKLIKIISGSVELKNNGVLIRINKKKKLFIEFNKFFGMRQKIKPLKDYHFIKISSLFEFGSTEHPVTAGAICFIYNFVAEILEWYFYHNKPYLSLNNKTIYYESEKVVRISVYATLVFNVLMVLISILKILMEKIIYAIRRKKRKV